MVLELEGKGETVLLSIIDYSSAPIFPFLDNSDATGLDLSE